MRLTDAVVIDVGQEEDRAGPARGAAQRERRRRADEQIAVRGEGERARLGDARIFLQTEAGGRRGVRHVQAASAERGSGRAAVGLQLRVGPRRRLRRARASGDERDDREPREPRPERRPRALHRGESIRKPIRAPARPFHPTRPTLPVCSPHVSLERPRARDHQLLRTPPVRLDRGALERLVERGVRPGRPFHHLAQLRALARRPDRDRRRGRAHRARLFLFSRDGHSRLRDRRRLHDVRHQRAGADLRAQTLARMERFSGPRILRGVSRGVLRPHDRPRKRRDRGLRGRAGTGRRRSRSSCAPPTRPRRRRGWSPS